MDRKWYASEIDIGQLLDFFPEFIYRMSQVSRKWLDVNNISYDKPSRMFKLSTPQDITSFDNIQMVFIL